MDRKELIKSFIDFYKSKNHKEIPNHSLIPENDPTVLFTTAGMHPIIPYLLGQPHPQGKRLCNVQRCIRTVDFENIGDTYHHTFFEMLGKWSVGDYFKKQAIEYTFEFYTKILKIPIERLRVTCFEGNKDAEKDNEAAKVWLSLGIPKDRITFLPKEDNWWETPGPGPCGPDTEIFYWKSNNKPAPKIFNPKDTYWVEIGNDVLMQYEKDKNGNYKEAKQKNIDFGGGVERTISVLSGLEDNYLSSSFLPIIKEIEHLSNKPYKGNERTMRIIADHIKASVFIIADGIQPSNIGQGYVLRRLIRRTIMNLRKLGFVGTDLINPIAKKVFEIYDDYDILKKNKEKIFNEINKEENKFDETIEQGIREYKNIIKDNPKEISGKNAFLLYQSYGFPIEITEELAKEKNIKINLKEYEQELTKHQELSRTASAGTFKSGLADNSEQTTRLHTATHLLHAALRKILNQEVSQKGSNINSERLRFDFSFPRKLTNEEIKQIEELVNQAIKDKLPVIKETMPPEQAKKSGALGFFEHKYGDIVSVYTIKDFSKEICTGPHINNTSELGHFKIIKEEASASGVRRIKGILE